MRPNRPTRVARSAILLFIFASALPACSSQPQEYQILPADRAADLITTRKVVADGRITSARTRHHGSLTKPLGGLVSRDLTIQVDRTIKGTPPTTISVRNYRPLTPEEQRHFPDPYALHEQLHIRIAYDGKSGRHYRNLTLVPLGSPPHLEAYFRKAAEEVACDESREFQLPTATTKPSDAPQ